MPGGTGRRRGSHKQGTRARVWQQRGTEVDPSTTVLEPPQRQSGLVRLSTCGAFREHFLGIPGLFLLARLLGAREGRPGHARAGAGIGAGARLRLGFHDQGTVGTE